MKIPKQLSPKALKQLRAIDARLKAIERGERSPRNIRVTVFIPDALDDHLRSIAGSDPLLRSWLVERCLEAYLRDHPEVRNDAEEA